MKTKDKIVNEALKIFIAQGYERTSISLIADKCSLTKGAIYHHFVNKDELFYSCIDVMARDYEAWLKKRLDNARNVKSFLRMFLEYDDYFNTRDYYSNTTNFYPLVLDAKARLPDDRVKLIFGRFRGYLDEIRELLQKAKDTKEIADTVDCDAMALHIFVLFEGLILVFNLLGGVTDHKIIDKVLFDNVWKLIKA